MNRKTSLYLLLMQSGRKMRQFFGKVQKHKAPAAWNDKSRS